MLYTLKVMSVVRRDKGTSRPLDGSENPPVGHRRRSTFREPDEIRQPNVWAERHDEMDMIGENGFPQNVHSSITGRVENGTIDIDRGWTIDAGHSLPCMPREVGVHLICMMIGHINVPAL